MTIITGNFGTGKTEFAINLALAQSEPTTIIDLDIVNPYFRTADMAQLFAERGIKLIAPTYANSNVDVPALPPTIGGAIISGGNVIIDVGGDDQGAIALGRYAPDISVRDYRMLYVINIMRPECGTISEVEAMLRAIERKSRLQVTALVNNTHLKEATTPDTISEGICRGAHCASALGLPIAHTAVLSQFAHLIPAEYNPFIIEKHLLLPWEFPL